MAFKVLKEKVLIEYRCVYDLRFTVLYELFHKDSSLTIDIEKYLTRKSDFLNEFYVGVTDNHQQRFNDALKALTVETLRARPPLPSPCLKTIKLLLDECASKMDIHPVGQEISITVNVHPLELTDKEMDTLADALSIHWFNAEDITVISKPLAEITPTFLSDYKQFILYDFDEWLNLVKDELVKTPMPSLSVTAPVKLVKQTDNSVIDVMNIVKQLKTEMAGWLALEMIPLKEFSVDFDFLRSIEDANSKNEQNNATEKEPSSKPSRQEPKVDDDDPWTMEDDPYS